MPKYVNNTNNLITIVVNGQRKKIYPNKTINGGIELGSVPGLKMVSDKNKTIIPSSKSNKNNIEQKTNIINNSKYKKLEITENIKTDFSQLIEYELIHQNKFLNNYPSVTIAILTKDSYKLITDCCNSILKHVKYKNTTLMICDTGSTDRSVLNYYNILKTDCKKKGFNYQVCNVGEYHFSKNYNNAIRNHVKTDYVIIQNNDTIALNDYVTKMMKLAVINKVGSVGTRLYYPNKNIQHDGQIIFQPNKKHKLGTAGHVNLNQNPRNLKPEENNGVKLVDGNTGACVLIKTSIFKNVGGFDENFSDIFQDVDLMIRIPEKFNKFNYCIRDSELIHYDNASRLKSGLSPKKAQDMRKDSYYLYNKCEQNKWNKKLPKNPDFSIITLIKNIDQYKDLLNSLRCQIGKHTIELIGIPNYHNLYDSCFDALNNGIDVSSGNYLIMCHEDINVPSNFLNKIKMNINDLEEKNQRWGVIGPAGVSLDKIDSAFYLLDEKMKILNNNHNDVNNKNNQEVFSLDELCLITKKSNGIKFDDKKLKGFHFYGCNLCINSKFKGFKNFAIDSWCHHKSDGYKNINTKEKYTNFCRSALDFHYYLRNIGLNKWRSTTALGLNKEIIMFATPTYMDNDVYVLSAP